MGTKLEIRPGEGGEDAERFATELFQALTLHARKQGILGKVEGDDTRTLSAEVRPDRTLKSLVGTHRVQRIPPGEKRGRRHTSTATVALVQTHEVRFDLQEKDLEVDFFRGTGPGGQHRNKTSTAVRLRHKPTGIVVTRTSGRSQGANLQSARLELEGKLLALEEQAAHQKSNSERGEQVKGGREAKTFTHNQQRDESLSHQDGRRWRMGDFFKGRI